MFASIIIYTYKRRDFILEAIKSVLSQDIPRDEYEIIVSKAFRDPKIDAEIDNLVDFNIFVDEKAHGKKLVPAFERARGEVVFLLDDDDMFKPGKIRHVLSLFEKDSKLIFVHNSIEKVDEKGKELKDGVEPVPSHEILSDNSNPDKRVISSFLKYRANWYSSCMAFRREAILQRISYLKEIGQSVDPFLFYMILSVPGHMILSPQRLTSYRVHNSTTNYDLKYDDFIARRKTFYYNSLAIYQKAEAMHQGLPTKLSVEAGVTHLQAIADFFDTSSGRRKALKNAINLLKALRQIRIRQYVFWAALEGLKSIIGKSAIYLYYRYDATRVSA